ncbi:MAG: MBL fold metallo-hydrolase [Anaerolineales bacterium]|nr:MBL fold metallo-hydrolase [Anaerolineales bacterium]
MERLSESEHFTLHPLSEGIYAAIATEAGAGFSNAGLVDLGERTLVFDTFENPPAAEDLLKASLQLIGRKPEVVIISHFHPDHWAGAQVFAGSTILATERTLQEMIPIAEEMLADKKKPAVIERDIRRSEKLLAKEKDPERRRLLQNAIARQQHMLQALPTLEPTLPNQTFEGNLVFHGTKRSAELIATGRGHTASDCVLRLDDDGVAFIGDLGFFQSQPFMPYGYPDEWIARLEEMADWEIETFVPGHGPLGGKDDLALEARYIQVLEEMVRQVVQRGGTVKDALRQTLPAPFDGWQGLGHRFEANVRATFKRQSGG